MAKLITFDLRPERKNPPKLLRFYADPSEEVHFSSKREGGSIKVSDGIISEICSGLAKTFGLKNKAHVSELFADRSMSSYNLFRLERFGTADVRMIDSNGGIFWARLTKDGKSIRIEDIDDEKNFMLDCEDLIEEEERQGNTCCISSASLN